MGYNAKIGFINMYLEITHRILNQHHDHHMKALKKSKFEPSKDRLHSILFIHESQFKGNLYQKYFQNHHLKCTNC